MAPPRTVETAAQSGVPAERHDDAHAPADLVSLDERQALRRQITLDQTTHKIVYEALDTRTGEVVYQLPDPRYLKAYAEQLRADKKPGSPKLKRLA